MSSILKVDAIQNANGTSAISIDSSGNLTAPGNLDLTGYVKNNNPCFHVKDNATYTSGVLFSGSSNLQIPINVGNHFLGSNGTFSAPFQGIYMFHVLTMAQGGSYVRAAIRHNSTTIQEHRTNDGNVGHYMQASSSVIVNMAQNDTFSVIWSAGTIAGNHNEKQMMGYLIG
tara:strand:- start:273 stop:785 length:513 start_codon:yes stop_codon:yes gene_type:complete